MEEEEAASFLAEAFTSASLLGRLLQAFITTSCSIFFRIPTSRSCEGQPQGTETGT